MELVASKPELQHRVRMVAQVLERLFAAGSVAQLGDNSIAFTRFRNHPDAEYVALIEILKDNQDVVRCMLLNFASAPIASAYKM